MKNKLLIIIGVLTCIMALPLKAHAYRHGYEMQTEDVYALARHDLAVYYDESEDDLIEYIPSFTGVRVIYTGDSWLEIEYTVKKETKTGWVTKGDFNSDCLVYDGRDKQIAADGAYQFVWQTPGFSEDPVLDTLKTTPSEKDIPFSYIPVTLTYAGRDSYYITRTDTGDYLYYDSFTAGRNTYKRWGSKLKAGLFILRRYKDKYGIQDVRTRRFLVPDGHGLLSFKNHSDAPFRVIRTDDRVLDKTSLRVFAQFDAEWAKDYYGEGKNENPESNNFTTSGCGIFSTLNAIYTLTGQYIDPHILADYAVRKGYRVEDNGTDSEFFRAAAHKFGKDYGFEFDGESGSIAELKKKLKKGDVAIGHVPGHYVAIVDYDSKTKKYLLLDPHYLPKRETCPYGDWVSRTVLEESDNLRAYMLYFYKKTDL